MGVIERGLYLNVKNDSNGKAKIYFQKDGEEHYVSGYDGYITDIRIKKVNVERPFKVFEIDLEDEGEKAILSLPYTADFSWLALNSLASIDGPFGKIEFSPWNSAYKGKSQKILSIYMNGEKLEWKYKMGKDDGEVPPVDYTNMGTEDDPEWKGDDTKRQLFFRDLAEELGKKVRGEIKKNGVADGGLPATDTSITEG